MKKILLLVALSALAGAASSQTTIFTNVVKGDGTSNFAGYGYAAGGAGVDNLAATNTATKMILTKITTTAAAGTAITAGKFSIVNFGAAAITARMRIRYFLDNTTTPNTPGAYFTGSTFGATALNPGVTTYSFTPGISVPATSFWFGITFDNSTNTTGATATDLNNLGVGLFYAPSVGSIGVGSLSNGFVTTSPTGGNVNNPASTSIDFGNNPTTGLPMNFGLEFQVAAVPEPSAFAALGLGAAVMLRRRKKA